MTLPLVSQSTLELPTLDWSQLPRRYMNPGELEVLIALIRTVSPNGVLEIGVNAGRTARAILDHVPGILHYQGIDVPQSYITSKLVQRMEVPAIPAAMVRSDPRFELLLRPRGSLDLKPQDLRPCDAIFIDGDHGSAAVIHDTALARALVRPGGIIIWHDYHQLGTVDVRDVLDRMHQDGDPIRHVENTWLAFERKPISHSAV